MRYQLAWWEDTGYKQLASLLNLWVAAIYLNRCYKNSKNTDVSGTERSVLNSHPHLNNQYSTLTPAHAIPRMRVNNSSNKVF